MNFTLQLATIRSVNLRCEPRPIRPIPHFTKCTYKLLEHLRSVKPKLDEHMCIIRNRNRLKKENGTYFTESEEEFWYELYQYFDN